MKINESLPVQVTAPTSRVNGDADSQNLEQAKPVQDKVSVTSSQERAAVDAARAAVSSSRAQHVQEIIKAVKSGQYYPSPQQIAQRLVNEAEIEARVRAMMSK